MARIPLFDAAPEITIPGLEHVTYEADNVRRVIDVTVSGARKWGKSQFILQALRTLGGALPPHSPGLDPVEKKFQQQAWSGMMEPDEVGPGGSVQHYVCHWRPLRGRSLRNRFHLLCRTPKVFSNFALFLICTAVFLYAATYLVNVGERLAAIGLAVVLAASGWLFQISHQVRSLASSIEVVFWDVPGEWCIRRDGRGPSAPPTIGVTINSPADSQDHEQKPTQGHDDQRGGRALTEFLGLLIERRLAIGAPYSYAPVLICNPLRCMDSKPDNLNADAVFNDSPVAQLLENTALVTQDVPDAVLLLVVNYKKLMVRLLDSDNFGDMFHVKVVETTQAREPEEFTLHTEAIRDLEASLKKRAQQLSQELKIMEYDAAELMQTKESAQNSGSSHVLEFHYSAIRGRSLRGRARSKFLRWLLREIWRPMDGVKPPTFEHKHTAAPSQLRRQNPSMARPSVGKLQEPQA